MGLHGLRRWLLRSLPPLVIIGGFVCWTVAYRLGWRIPIESNGAQALCAGLTAGAAFGVTQVDVAWAGIRRRGKLGLWIMVATGVVVLLCGLVALPEHWLVGFAIQYVALVLSLIGLYVWTDKSATVQQPLEPLKS